MSGTKKKAKIRYVVQCNTHGRESDLWDGRMVVVTKPVNKRERNGGCPICASEKRVAEAA